MKMNMMIKMIYFNEVFEKYSDVVAVTKITFELRYPFPDCYLI